MKPLADVIGWVALLAVIVLCAGTPDLLDAIRARVAAPQEQCR